MSTARIQIEHNGKTYGGHIATIDRTTLGSPSHGVVSAWLHTKWLGGGVGVGGLCLDEPLKDDDGKFIKRVGTAYGLDHIMQVMETVGVEKWEDLPGKHIIVLFEGKSIWGATSVGIAGITNGKVLIYKDHVSEWDEKENN